jgi:mRNA-degrading endonuclease YafQ of YafQ-DinJ toxin-antitoxin module
MVDNDFDDFDKKVLSQFMRDQQEIINSLTEENQKLCAEISVLRNEIQKEKEINDRIIKGGLKSSALQQILR